MFQTWTVLPAMQWLRRETLGVRRTTHFGVREYCKKCLCHLSIVYDGDARADGTGTRWLAAGTFDLDHEDGALLLVKYQADQKWCRAREKAAKIVESLKQVRCRCSGAAGGPLEEPSNKLCVAGSSANGESISSSTASGSVSSEKSSSSSEKSSTPSCSQPAVSAAEKATRAIVPSQSAVAGLGKTPPSNGPPDDEPPLKRQKTLICTTASEHNFADIHDEDRSAADSNDSTLRDNLRQVAEAEHFFGGRLASCEHISVADKPAWFRLPNDRLVRRSYAS